MRLWVGALSSFLIAGCDGAPPMTDAGDTPTACTDDAMCDDGLFCNGVEHCTPDAAEADAFGCTRTDIPCVAGQRCDEDMDMCLTTCEVLADADGDGVDAIECGGIDCDDANPDRNPDATEICDGENVDEDCDPTTFGDRDADGDSYVDVACCNDTNCGDDCSDSRRDMHPGFAETCDFLDNDCDGLIDEVVGVSGFADEDRDLHGDPASPMMACPEAPGFSTTDDDCDDMDPEVHGAQLEICDRKDNDCDMLVDEAPAAVTWYADEDADGFGTDGAATQVSCTPIPEFSLRSSDCNDMDRLISPSARELCNGEDDDCNGRADFMIRTGDLEDDDGDGFADMVCGGADCDDRSAAVHPGALEICDGVDNDCNGVADGADAMAQWYLDLDGDGFGDEGMPAIESCSPQPARVPRGGDCNDIDGAIHPGISDTCDTVDQDCDGATDEDSVRFAYYVDADGDGFGLSTGPIEFACVRPSGRALNPGDCEDGSATRYPGAPELCNLADDDCDMMTDEDAPTTWYPDVDRDGHGVPGGSIVTCNPPAGYADVSDDCDDGNAARFPGNPELCDLVDNDCDSTPDDGASAACTVAQGTGTCMAGTCTVASCNAGFENCDGTFSTGCEVEVARNPSHCGGCGMRCGLGDTCGRTTAGMCDRSPFVFLAAGEHNHFAIRATGTVIAWGLGSSGQLGLGNVNQSVPLPIFYDAMWAAGSDDSTCVVNAARRLFCTGANFYGELGDPAVTTSRSSFAVAPSLMNVAQVGNGDTHTCALRTDGTVWCFGRRSYGQVGDGVVNTSVPQRTPTLVPGIDDAVDLFVGQDHTCVRRPLGGGGFRLQCWGANNSGQVGDGTFVHPRSSPADVVGLPSDVVGFMRGYSLHTCVWTSSGAAYCWGQPNSGTFANGDGSSAAVAAPVPMTDLSGAAVADVVGGCSSHYTACVLRNRGASPVGHEVWCTGFDDVGQIGDGPTRTDRLRLAPTLNETAAGPLDGITHLSCTRRSMCAIRATDNRILCWGADDNESLGSGSASNLPQYSPVVVTGL